LHGWDAEQLLTALQPLSQHEGWSLAGYDGSWAEEWSRSASVVLLTLVNDEREQAAPFFENALESDGCSTGQTC
jgi:hypothetical protein